MAGTGGDHTILVVDDEPAVADMAAAQLEREYEVRTAYGGREALDALDASIDVVLLDRRMPDLSGDEVLEQIRAGDVDCRVVILSAVSPDFDVLEMPFDDYLCKPVAGDHLMNAVAHQIETLGNDTIREYLALASKRDLLAETKSTYELDRHEGYQQLLERTEAARERVAEEPELDVQPELLADIERI